jgi:hypothetical protein
MATQKYSRVNQIGTFTGDEFTVFSNSGVLASLDVTTAGGTENVTMKLQMKVANDKWVDVPGAVTAARTTAGTDTLCVVPGIAQVANQAVNYAPPSKVRLVITHSAAVQAWTYAVQMESISIN